MNTTDLQNYTLEQKKTVYNLALEAARTQVELALAVRASIEAEAPQYVGRSHGLLADAERSLYKARTFANTPADLPEAQNRYRNNES